MLNLKYNTATVHISGLEIRTEGTEFEYAQNACGSLTRSRRMATAKGEYATAAEALEAAESLARSINKKVCKTCRAAAEKAITEAPAPVVEVVEVAEAPAARPTVRPALGPSAADGWELLYDKPKQNAEVARRFKGEKAEYALVCKATGHVRPLARLVSERAVRSTGDWCPCGGH